MPLELRWPITLPSAELTAINRLHDACAQGDASVVLRALDALPTRALTLPVMLQTPLTRAVQNGHTDLAQALVERMVALDVPVDEAIHLVSDSRTSGPAPEVERVPRALEVALHHRQWPVMRRLLELGADPDATIGSGADPRRPLLHAVVERLDGALDLLLEFHADPNLASGQSNPPLHRALILGRVEPVHALLVNGADPNVPALHDRGTPLHTLVQNWRTVHHARHLVNLDLLMRGGANPWIHNAVGQSVWDVAPETVLPCLMQASREQEKTVLLQTAQEPSGPMPLRARAARSRL